MGAGQMGGAGTSTEPLLLVEDLTHIAGGGELTITVGSKTLQAADDGKRPDFKAGDGLYSLRIPQSTGSVALKVSNATESWSGKADMTGVSGFIPLKIILVKGGTFTVAEIPKMPAAGAGGAAGQMGAGQMGGGQLPAGQMGAGMTGMTGQMGAGMAGQMGAGQMGAGMAGQMGASATLPGQTGMTPPTGATSASTATTSWAPPAEGASSTDGGTFGLMVAFALFFGAFTGGIGFWLGRRQGHADSQLPPA